MFIGSAFATSVEVAIKRGRTVVDWIPVPKSAFGVLLAFLTTVSLSGDKEEMVDVVVSFQRTFRPSDDPRRAFSQMVAKQRLLFVVGLKVLVIPAVDVLRARIFAFVAISNKSLNVDGVLPEKLGA